MTDMETVREYLIEICSSIEEDDLQISEGPEYLWSKKGMGVILSGADVEKFDYAINEFCTDDYIKSNFPLSYIKNEFQSIISEALQLPEGDRPKFIVDELDDLRSKLKKRIKEMNFVIPISNLKIENNFNIGNVSFKKFDDIKNKIEEICNADEDEKLQEEIDRRCEYFAKTCAEVHVQGVPIFAKDKAFNQVRLAVNCLKLYNHPDDPIWGIKGEMLHPEIRTTFCYENDVSKSNPKWNISMEWILKPEEYEITHKKLEFMNEYHFNELDEILNKPRHNDFETRILTSIYWFGESLNTPLKKEEDMIYKKKKLKHQNLEYFRLGERLIKLFTALEAILIFDKTDPITDCILERTTLLLDISEDQREDFKVRLEKLYEVRSQIVHYGNTSVSQQDVLYFTRIVRSVIFDLLKLRITHEIKHLNNLKKYFDELE